jgi:hypothetical protein
MCNAHAAATPIFVLPGSIIDVASGLSLAEFKRDKRGLVAKRKFGM